MMQSHQELQTKNHCKVWVKFIRQIIHDSLMKIQLIKMRHKLKKYRTNQNCK